MCARLSFSWYTPILDIGYRRPLVAEDVWSVREEDTAKELSALWEEAWGQERASKGEQASLVRALHRVFGLRFWLGGTLKLANDASQFVGPIFLSQIIRYCGDESAPIWKGYVFAGSIFLGQIVGMLSENQYFDQLMR